MISLFIVCMKCIFIRIVRLCQIQASLGVIKKCVAVKQVERAVYLLAIVYLIKG